MSLFHISLIYQRLDNTRDNTVTAAAAGVTQHSGTLEAAVSVQLRDAYSVAASITLRDHMRMRHLESETRICRAFKRQLCCKIDDDGGL